jgi:putative Mn2+ efflux pump MntP
MPFNTTEAKSIFSSVTFWGAILTALAIAVPSLTAKFGLTTANTSQDATWIVGFFTTVMTIYGRFAAKQVVTLTGSASGGVKGTKG